MENNSKDCQYKGLNSSFSLVWASRYGREWATRESYYCGLMNQCQSAELHHVPRAQLLHKALGHRSKLMHFVTLLEWVVSPQRAPCCDCVVGRHSTSMGTAGEEWEPMSLTLRGHPGLVPVIALEGLWPGAFLVISKRKR